MKRRLVLSGLCLAAAVAAPTVLAQPAANAVNNVVSFAASASVEVPHDFLSLTLNTTREAGDAAAVQKALQQAVEAALAVARPAAQPGAMEVRTGNFSIYPRHASQGRISGWQGTAEIVLEGTDVPRITQAAARIQTLSVARVSQGLSRQARDKHEAAVQAQAVAQYRAKAQELAKLFGFGGYELREVNVSTQEPGLTPVPLMMRAKADVMTAEAAPLPVEAGKALVTVTVSGSVALKP
ncbi:MAG: SIMPL domain-containing protein [Caldimonas sp.]|jgi:predicted secreted protein|uniref:SIMPL domain-containing protein n=1 Tax=Caldimonas sp. TaxID=2838790 RepID=UPI00391DBC3D